MSRWSCALPCCLMTVLASSIGLAADANDSSPVHWPQWRGTEQNGVSRATGLPLVWSATSNIAWKCALPPWGNSTPVIWDKAIFVTSHTDDNRLLLLKVDKTSGRIEWTQPVGTGAATYPDPKIKGNLRERPVFHRTQNLASPSPTTDGQVVVVHFGNGDLASYDFSGRQLWKRNLQKDYAPFTIWWGRANSPVLWGDLVISVCIQDSLSDLRSQPSPSYIVAHDKRTGREMWKTMRMTGAEAEDADAYTTPVFWKGQMIVMGGRQLDGYDPRTGKQLWWLGGLEGSRVITSSVVADDMVYTTQGKRAPLLAIRLVGEGKRPASDIAWKDEQNTPDSPTPVVSAGLLFLVTDQGIAKCLDAKTGRLYWQERLKGQHRARRWLRRAGSTSLTSKGQRPWWRPGESSRSWPRTS